MNKSNLSSLDKQGGVNSGTYIPIESTQKGKGITRRSDQMKNYETSPLSPQYKKVICMAAKGSSLPLEYEKKLNATGPNEYKGRVSEEIKELPKREKQTHQNIEYIYGYSLYVLIYF